MAVCADLLLHALYPTMLSAWEMPSDPLASPVHGCHALLE